VSDAEVPPTHRLEQGRAEQNARKSEARRRREAEQEDRWEQERQEAYRKVNLPDHPDPLDRLFNKYPYRWPDFFRWLHRTALRELLRDYSKGQIAKEIARYEEHLAAEHARLEALPDDERRTASGSAYELPTALATTNWFHVLVHVLQALKIWEEKGAEAGMLALLSDAEAGSIWELGTANDDAVKAGGAGTRKPDVERAEEKQRVLQAFLDARKKLSGREFTPTYEEAARQLGCSATQVRNVLKSLNITRENYKLVPLD
jgi:hypothetical protein